MSESTPRPTEADVAALLAGHRLHASMNHCVACRWRPTPDAGSLVDQHTRHVAAVARGLFAARDAEHQREWHDRYDEGYASGRDEAETRDLNYDAMTARAEAAERDRDEARRELADRDAAIKALVAECEDAERPTRRTIFGAILRTDTIRALLPTEDDA